MLVWSPVSVELRRVRLEKIAIFQLFHQNTHLLQTYTGHNRQIQNVRCERHMEIHLNISLEKGSLPLANDFVCFNIQTEQFSFLSQGVGKNIGWMSI